MNKSVKNWDFVVSKLMITHFLCDYIFLSQNEHISGENNKSILTSIIYIVVLALAANVF